MAVLMRSAVLLVFIACLSLAPARAAESRLGVVVAVALGGNAPWLERVRVGLQAERARVDAAEDLRGYRVSVTTPVTRLAPHVAVAGLIGERCAWLGAGVGYDAAAGRMTVPVDLNVGALSVAMDGAAVGGGATAALASRGCFRRADTGGASAAPAPVSGTPTVRSPVSKAVTASAEATTPSATINASAGAMPWFATPQPVATPTQAGSAGSYTTATPPAPGASSGTSSGASPGTSTATTEPSRQYVFTVSFPNGVSFNPVPIIK